MREELQAAGGDVEKQQAIRARYALRLQAIQREAAAPRYAEVIRGFGSVDLLNRNTGNKRDQQAIEGILKQLLEETKKNRPQAALTV